MKKTIIIVAIVIAIIALMNSYSEDSPSKQADIDDEEQIDENLVDCPVCNGSGFIPTGESCAMCKGTGKMKEKNAQQLKDGIDYIDRTGHLPGEVPGGNNDNNNATTGKRMVCPFCGGKECCPTCNGTGHIDDLSQDPQPLCPTCKGSGICIKCNNTGFMPY